MKTNLSSTTPSQLETDCLVVVVLDHSEDRSEKEKAEKTSPHLQSSATTRPLSPPPKTSSPAAKSPARFRNHASAQSRRFESEASAPHRRRQSEELFRRRIAQTGGHSRPHAERKKHSQLRLRAWCWRRSSFALSGSRYRRRRHHRRLRSRLLQERPQG